MKDHRSHLLASCVLLAGATALSLTSGCSGSTAPPEQHLGEASQHLDGDQCIFFDVNGKDTICHHTGSVSHPFTLIKISDQGCIDGHAAHAQDYITSLDPASSLYDPTCNGQGCLPTAAPCDGTLDCCTGSCVSGTCQSTGPIGCHAAISPIGDLDYVGPIDTVGNAVLYHSHDGTCSGDINTDVVVVVIAAASQADADTKCQSVLPGSFAATAEWVGLEQFWACEL